MNGLKKRFISRAGVSLGVLILFLCSSADAQRRNPVATPVTAPGMTTMLNTGASSASLFADSKNTTLIGQWLHGSFFAVFVKDSIAYLGNERVFTLLNIADPVQPKKISSLILPSPIHGIYVAGDYAYVADDVNGLQIIDVADPENIRLTGSIITGGKAYGVYVRDEFVYVADGTNGLRIVLADTPSRPALLGRCDTENAVGIDVAGDYAYIADETNGMRIIDVSNPLNPVETGSLETGDRAYSVCISGDYAFIADGYNGMKIADIRNPAAPLETGRYMTATTARSVRAAGNFAYVVDGYINTGGLIIIDVTDPAHPVKTGAFITDGVSRQVSVSGSCAYLSDERNGLRIIDVGNPCEPEEIGRYDNGDFAYDIETSGNYAYIADGAAGLKIIDVAIASSPFEAGAYDTGGTAYGIHIAEDYAYLADGEDGLRIIDIRTPENPVETGYFDTDGIAYKVAVSGEYAYVADGKEGLQIIDVGNPASPLFTGSYDIPLTQAHGDTGGTAYGVYVSGDYAYMTYSIAGLRIVDISDPAHPVEAGIFDPGVNGEDVYVRGANVYIADNWSGLIAINVSNPDNTVKLPGPDNQTGGPAYGVYGLDNFLYLANSTYGVRIFDISDTAAVVEAGYYVSGGDVRGVYAEGNFIYVANGRRGLDIIRNDLALLSFSDELYDFGEVAVGDSLTWNTLTIRNNTDDFVRIYNMTSNRQEFNVTGLPFPLDILPGYTMDAAVQFSPDSAGPVDAVLSIATDLPGMPVKDIALRGFGVSVTGIGDYPEPEAPASFDLQANYPNPFNAGTVISYSVPQRTPVKIIIYTVTGMKIRTLESADKAPGTYSLTWDGSDDRGRAVASGIYFYTLRAGSFTRSRKMVLLR